MFCIFFKTALIWGGCEFGGAVSRNPLFFLDRCAVWTLCGDSLEKEGSSALNKCQSERQNTEQRQIQKKIIIFVFAEKQYWGNDPLNPREEMRKVRECRSMGSRVRETVCGGGGEIPQRTFTRGKLFFGEGKKG